MWTIGENATTVAKETRVVTYLVPHKFEFAIRWKNDSHFRAAEGRWKRFSPLPYLKEGVVLHQSDGKTKKQRINVNGLKDYRLRWELSKHIAGHSWLTLFNLTLKAEVAILTFLFACDASFSKEGVDLCLLTTFQLNSLLCLKTSTSWSSVSFYRG